MDWGGLLGGIGNLFKSGASGLGNLANQGASALGQGAGAISGGIGNLFNSFGSGYGGGGGGGQQGPSAGGQQNPQMGQKSGGTGLFGGMFGGGGSKSVLPGLAGLFGSQLIGNPKAPQLPDSFAKYQQQAQSGGNPLGQQSNQYLQSIVSGQNTSANDAATHSLDLNYQEQLRQLNGMYKSLRPGTDPTSDTTYQRDLSNLNDQYTRQKAQVLSQQQQGAAQAGIASSGQSMNEQATAIDTQVSQLAQQWQMDAQQRQALREMLMQLSGQSALGGLFNNYMPGQQRQQTTT